MLAALVSVFTRLFAYVARPLIASLPDRGSRRRGHQAEGPPRDSLPAEPLLAPDPAFIVAHLYPRSSCGVADEHQVNRTVFGYVALLYGSRSSELERAGCGQRSHARALQEIADGLKAGENILLYPAAA